MSTLLMCLSVAAIVGCGLLSGILLAFSLVVMRALREQPAATAMATMQRINALILTPMFLALFLATPTACAALAALSWKALPDAAAWSLALGASACLAGPLAITLGRNVPLNERLARASLAQAEQAWPTYVDDWLRWNHLRTALGALATALLVLGLVLATRAG